MTALEPDQSIAARLTGLEPGAQPSARRNKTVGGGRDDGTLIEDPGVRAPLVLGNRSFGEVTDIVCGYAEAAIPKLMHALAAYSDPDARRRYLQWNVAGEMGG